MAGRLMTLGYFAPMPPAASGIADYAVAMLEGLRPLGEVRLNTAGAVNLYHVGNNGLHTEIYRRALAEPGVVVLHDAMLHHFLLGSLNEDAYLEEFAYNYGEWERGLAANLWRRRAGAMADPTYFRYPLLRRLAERSRVVLVHGQAARRRVLAHSPQAKVVVIQHLRLGPMMESHWTSDQAGAERARFRREELGLRSEEMLVGLYGYLRESKRLAAVVEAVEALRGQGVPVRLLVAGGFASDDYRRAWEPRLQRHPAVIFLPGGNVERFGRLLSAADVCVNLKYPSAGESSGIAARALALGTPLVLSSIDKEDDAEFPAGTYAPVLTGVAEQGSLLAVLSWLLNDRDARRALAMEGQRWCRAAMEPAAICSQVWRVALGVAELDRGCGRA